MTKRPLMKYVAFLIIILTGCATATRSDVVSAGVRDTLVSSLTPLKLAMCIDRNVDDNSAFGSLDSKVIDPGTEPVEVVVRNGATTYAVVKISTFERGSTASFYYGGVANMHPGDAYKMMSKGCK